ncbi:hypothetical protein MHBO_001491, partial [Bonamia ostreae]
MIESQPIEMKTQYLSYQVEASSLQEKNNDIEDNEYTNYAHRNESEKLPQNEIEQNKAIIQNKNDEDYISKSFIQNEFLAKPSKQYNQKCSCKQNNNSSITCDYTDQSMDQTESEEKVLDKKATKESQIEQNLDINNEIDNKTKDSFVIQSFEDEDRKQKNEKRVIDIKTTITNHPVEKDSIYYL